MSESAFIAFMILVKALREELEDHEGWWSQQAHNLATAMRVQHWPRMNSNHRVQAATGIIVMCLPSACQPEHPLSTEYQLCDFISVLP